MNNFEENWHKHFVPECFFDTVLLKKLLETNKRLFHKKGCNNVVKDLDERLKEKFAVGLIDRDKRELEYLKNCTVLYNGDRIILWKHKDRFQFLIQLNPPLENWIITILNDNGLRIEDFGYSREFKKLKKQIKEDIDDEKDHKLDKLVNAVIKTDCPTIKKIRSILIYLKERNYQIDINELING